MTSTDGESDWQRRYDESVERESARLDARLPSTDAEVITASLATGWWGTCFG